MALDRLNVTTARASHRIVGFAPVSRSDAVALVLGSAPSVASLERQQYYGLPRNAFWTIMAKLFGVGADRPYAERLAALTEHRVALWDVIRSCHRPGSLDSAIDLKSAEPNDFASFLTDHAQLRRIFFNGRKAEQMFRQMVLPGLGQRAEILDFKSLPSTSPAHAAMNFDEKLQRWRAVSSAVALRES